MSDEPTSKGGAALPPLPELISIPTQLIEPWMGIPASQYVDLRLTRQDIDRFYFAFAKCLQAQDALQTCLVDWSNGNTDGANVAMHNSRRLNIESFNEIRQFFIALMASATQSPPDAGR